MAGKAESRENLGRETRLPQLFVIAYSQFACAETAFSALLKVVYFRRIPRKRAVPGEIRESGCTISGQAAVDELHSIDSKRDIVANFFLTPGIAGVCSHSFFDSY
jgi:hypothetical protein